MALASPDAFGLLVAILAVIVAALIRRRRVASLAVPSLGTFRGGPPSLRAVLLPLLVVARCVALALLVVAIARPQSGGVPVANSADAVDIFVVLDVSSSMASEDFPPLNRLETARQVITAFVDGRPADRIGLITFARYSVLKCPLTLDHELVRLQLATARLASGEDDGTAIGVALASAVRHLRQSPAKSRVVILLTDGENNRSTIDPETGAELSRALGVTVYAIGVGRTPDERGEAEGPTRVEGFDEEAMRAIADRTGGQYYRADDVRTLRAVFDTIDRLERSPVPMPLYLHRREWFALFASAALAIAALELLLRHTVLRTLP
jgi:Ca-activated chloride channel family protein